MRMLTRGVLIPASVQRAFSLRLMVTQSKPEMNAEQRVFLPGSVYVIPAMGQRDSAASIALLNALVQTFRSIQG
jgi:hypothetical protein